MVVPTDPAFEEHLAAAERGSGKSNRCAWGNRRLSNKNRLFWLPLSSDWAPTREEPPALEIDALVGEEVGTEPNVAHKDFEELEDTGGSRDDRVDRRMISALAIRIKGGKGKGRVKDQERRKRGKERENMSGRREEEGGSRARPGPSAYCILSHSAMHM